MSPKEIQLAEAELEEKEMKLKRRMIATIRFVGELCKESLLKTTIIHDCIISLIGVSDANGEWTGWKEVQDEQFIELLCRLLHTIGYKLENTASDQQLVKIDWYFDQLRTLSKDKSLNSRIRFSLEEVIALRLNGWQQRREEEGPAKLDQIHQKAAYEESMKAQRSQQQSHQPNMYNMGNNMSMNSGGRGPMAGNQGSNQFGGGGGPIRQSGPGSGQYAPQDPYGGSGGGNRNMVSFGNNQYSDARDIGGYGGRGGGGGGQTAPPRGGPGGPGGYGMYGGNVPPYSDRDNRDPRDYDRDSRSFGRSNSMGPTSSGYEGRDVGATGARGGGNYGPNNTQDFRRYNSDQMNPGSGPMHPSNVGNRGSYGPSGVSPPSSSTGVSNNMYGGNSGGGSGSGGGNLGGIDFIEKRLIDRISSIVDEYLHIKDSNELLVSLKELQQNEAVGHLILKVIDSYLNSKTDTQIELINMLTSISGFLSAKTEEVEAALMRCEALTMLTDTITDFKMVRKSFVLIGLF